MDSHPARVYPARHAARLAAYAVDEAQVAASFLSTASLLSIVRTPSRAALIITVGCAGALAAAWFFELFMGLAPCPLCLEQRIPYYVGLPFALMTTLVALAGYPRTARVFLALLAVLMFGNMALAIFHAGVEWQFWPGPTSCTGAPVMTQGDILSALKDAHVPRCDEAAWRLFGLSMAGWNALIAAALGLIALVAAATGRTPKAG